MMQPVDDFFHEFRQEVLAGAAAASDFQLTEFMSVFEHELVESGQIEGMEICHFRHPGIGVRVDGYWMNEDDGIDLFIADYTGREALESLTRTDVAAIFRRIGKFYSKALHDGLYRDIEPASPAYGLARAIAERRGDIGRLNIYLLSERKLSDQFTQVEMNEHLRGVPVAFHVWDLGRLHRLRSARNAREPIEIDMDQVMEGGVPCLPAHSESTDVRSYLLAIPGSLIADLYARYGSRLLEQNVRAFLQARGAVNRGIRDTIVDEPNMFFAYNNGITATATDIEVEQRDGASFLRRATDLQIVNGGQTTASLFQTRLKQNVDLAGIHVQMKLTIVSPERAEHVVPRISEYANTQNRVNAADFFSNHPFHVAMEQYSRRIWAPAEEGAQRETKWFYERARGQFADAQSKLTPAEKKRFLAEYPKKQMFSKTDLAKFDNVWDENPRYVNLGAQKNFAQYARRIGEEWKTTPERFDEHYFRQAVARAIIFRQTERIVSSQPWYGGGYRANIVAYTLGLLAEIARQSDRSVDFQKVWQIQATTADIDRSIATTSRLVHDHLMSPPQGVTNISEWAKKEDCWQSLLKCIDHRQERLDLSCLVA